MCLFTREEHAAINKYSQFRLKIELIVSTKPTLKSKTYKYICIYMYSIQHIGWNIHNGHTQRSFNKKYG